MGSETMMRISIDGAPHAVHHYFQQCPESPNGTRVAYSVLREDGRTDVYVCRTDGSEQRLVATVGGQSAHMGASTTWIDDRTLAFADVASFRVHLADLGTGQTRVLEGSVGEYSPVNGKIVFHSPGKTLPRGIYDLDVETGARRLLIGMDDVEPFADTMRKPFLPQQWRLDHPYWSPDATKLTFQIKADTHSNPEGDFSFCARADGSDIRYICPKPMHVYWWDNESISGHDWAVKRDKHLRRWNLEGQMIEEVAGHGCHGAVSPDQEWVATESWYGSDPIVLRLYRRGGPEAVADLYVQPRDVNGEDFWEKHSHMHPAWSRDGKRVYFNAWPAEFPGPQVFALDVSRYLGQ